MKEGGLKGALTSLLDFSDWADGRIWSCVETLEPAQFTQHLDYSVGSIRDQLAHTLGAERAWLSRMQGEETAALWSDYTQFPDIAATRNAAKQAREALREHLADLNETSLREYYRWPMPPGRDDPPYPRWLTLLQLVNHGTDHRSQILLQLARHFKAPTCEIDLSRYWRLRSQTIRTANSGEFPITVMRSLFRYHQWAMDRVWQSVAEVAESEFTQPLAYSVGSIQQQLVHILNAERYWLRRLGAPSLPSLIDLAALDRASLQEIAAEQERWKAAWLSELDDAALMRLHSFHHPDSPSRLSWAKWQVLLHVVNHSIEHRAQILAQLNQQFDAETDAQDLLYFWQSAEAKQFS
ncbi:MAG: DinB family protein [Anaerolineaceae bacterium]|nr:DinB family protein [Anaerolineaceae bacterium]